MSFYSLRAPTATQDKKKFEHGGNIVFLWTLTLLSPTPVLVIKDESETNRVRLDLQYGLVSKGIYGKWEISVSRDPAAMPYHKVRRWTGDGLNILMGVLKI
jgi:hypothetical protein